MLQLKNVSLNKNIPVSIAADSIIAYDGTLYVKDGQSINEIQFIELPNDVQVTLRTVANVMENATSSFDGMAMQDMLGAWYASIFPKPGLHYQINLKELKDHKIVDAKYDNKVATVIASKDGKYHKFVFRLSDRYDSYDVRVMNNINYQGINFAVMPTGVCATITEDESLELSSNKKGFSGIKVVEDDAIAGDMKICSRGPDAAFYKGNKLYKIKIRK